MLFPHSLVRFGDQPLLVATSFALPSFPCRGNCRAPGIPSSQAPEVLVSSRVHLTGAGANAQAAYRRTEAQSGRLAGPSQRRERKSSPAEDLRGRSGASEPPPGGLELAGNLQAPRACPRQRRSAASSGCACNPMPLWRTLAVSARYSLLYIVVKFKSKANP